MEIDYKVMRFLETSGHPKNLVKRKAETIGTRVHSKQDCYGLSLSYLLGLEKKKKHTMMRKKWSMPRSIRRETKVWEWSHDPRIDEEVAEMEKMEALVAEAWKDYMMGW